MPELQERECDVLIVGSGPIGCGFARTLLDNDYACNNNLHVIMIDIGQQLSAAPGENLKNSFYYQRNVNNFTPIVQGTMQTISIAPNSDSLPYPADPSSFQPGNLNYCINNINPEQVPEKNMPAAATTYAIGGMATHWTCCIPRTEKGVQRPPPELGIDNNEWEELYPVAEKLFAKSDDLFDTSLRQRVLFDMLHTTYNDRCVSMPLAGQPNGELITWSGSDTVLGPLLDKKAPNGINESYNLEILEQHRCKKLVRESDDDSRISYAVVRDLQKKADWKIKAKFFVVACNPILTPQLLYNSNIRPTALGRYLMDQPMTFCQILLSTEIVMKIKALRDEDEEEKRSDAQTIHPHSKTPLIDPVPIPVKDFPPAILLIGTQEKPWHVQIHKDTFSYGMVPQSIDPRLVLDLRWFGQMEAKASNQVRFDSPRRDLMGMPQPIFETVLSPVDADMQHKMMKEMTEVAMQLGGFLPGAEPRCMPLGTSLHFQGTTRYGPKNDDTCVVNPDSKVWGIDNLFLGGNGLIPNPIALNPTLTSLCLAIKAARKILSLLDREP
ncbi:MAG: pyranose 2-oxidase [Linnemannia gamsii]|nr:MAG: pyranose 2-oxidase [Linnemannia gamsii]